MPTVAELYKLLREEAAPHIERRKQKTYGPDGRRWGPHGEEAGAEGQIALAIWHGGRPDFRNFIYGDGGVDVYLLLLIDGVPRWVAIDAKGVWKTPRELPIPSQGDFKVNPRTIYVQSYRPPGQNENANAIEKGPWPLNGWIWGHEVMKYPIKPYAGNDRLTHVVPSLAASSHLHPMDELKAIYLDQWRWRGCQQEPAVYCSEPKSEPKMESVHNPFRGTVAGATSWGSMS